MKYTSTRSEETVTLPQALLRGLAEDGGLYVPETLPKPFVDFELMKDMAYPTLAGYVVHQFLPDIEEAELYEMTEKAYGNGAFRVPDVISLHSLDDRVSVAELFHGRTCAFKDLALSLFPHLLVWAKKQEGGGKDILILTATSGDTGKAALEGFRDVEGIHIMVFYPSQGVSALQMDQMRKQRGNNVRVLGIKENFDEAQSRLKEIFQSDLRRDCEKKGILFSSANSINIGRLIPQVAYYVWVWLELRRRKIIGKGEGFHISVPTGNFGNILAGWMAKQAGVPIHRILCASNKNHILSDFFETGVYDVHRPFYTTSSPSMDILVSSNFERFLYYMSLSKQWVSEATKDLHDTGRYAVSSEMLACIRREMVGVWASEDETAAALRRIYEKWGYLMDPHTAVAYAGYEKEMLHASGHTVVMGTAHPYKFPHALALTLGLDGTGTPYDILRRMEWQTGISIPPALAALEQAPIQFSDVIGGDEMSEAIRMYAFALNGERKAR